MYKLNPKHASLIIIIMHFVPTFAMNRAEHTFREFE